VGDVGGEQGLQARDRRVLGGCQASRQRQHRRRRRVSDLLEVVVRWVVHRRVEQLVLEDLAVREYGAEAAPERTIERQVLEEIRVRVIHLPHVEMKPFAAVANSFSAGL
jgi:hypothetical protein